MLLAPTPTPEVSVTTRRSRRPAPRRSATLHRVRTSSARLAVACAVAGMAMFGAAASTHASPTETTADTIVIEHAFGVTEIVGTPERVLTLGWGPTEAALAVGVVPVAIPVGDGNGGNADGYHPWVADYLDDHDLERPALLSFTASGPLNFEEIAAFEPDLILAVEAGLDETQYEALSHIAPTVAHPGEAWATPWRDIIAITGHALGRADEAQAVLDDIDTTTAAAAETHPEFSGRTITAISIWDSQLLVWSPSEPRSRLLEQLGFEIGADDIAANYYLLSYEEAATITSDIVLVYHPNENARAEFEASPAAALMTQFADGRVATVVGEANVAAVSPPTALSWPWTIEPFIDLLADAVGAS